MRIPTFRSFMLRYGPHFGLILGYFSLGLFALLYAAIGHYIEATMAGIAFLFVCWVFWHFNRLSGGVLTRALKNRPPLKYR